MRLYEISNEYLSLLEAIENGEIPEECIADTLEAVKGEIDIKADNIACMLKNLIAEEEAINAEIVKLRARKEAKHRQCESLREYLSNILQGLGIYKIETARNAISFRKSEAVETDEGFIEWARANRDDLLTYGTPKANLTEIKKLIKSGTEIEGARLVERQNIQIK